MSTRGAGWIGFLPSAMIHGGVLVLLGVLWTFPIATPEVDAGRTPLGFAPSACIAVVDPPAPIEIPLGNAAETPEQADLLAAIEPQSLLAVLDEAAPEQATLAAIEDLDGGALIACATPHPRGRRHDTAACAQASESMPDRARAEPARAPLLITRIPPVYPREALRNGWEGEVVVEMTIAAGGEVIAATVRTSSKHEVLDQAACAAALQWIFAAQKGQDAFPRLAVLAIRFRLDG